MEKLMRGEWATPYWWTDFPDGVKNLKSFEQNLVQLGFVRPNNLDR